ncbi:AI-2E family transporter [Isoptericola halotolerans]|uniref:AI-2E family transporter n=1 Tax=Isoptericola halotolerans TaxID=300560 RepID=UPI00388D6382
MLGGYLRGTAIVATVDAVAIGIGLLVVGVPLALPLAVVVFLGAFVPLVGAVVAGALVALVALVTNGPVAALVVVAIVVAVNQLEGDLLAPLVMGKVLSLHPLAVLSALTAGTILAGIVGTLLAVPIAAVAWAAVKEWNATAPPGDELVPSSPPGRRLRPCG